MVGHWSNEPRKINQYTRYTYRDRSAFEFDGCEKKKMGFSFRIFFKNRIKYKCACATHTHIHRIDIDESSFKWLKCFGFYCARVIWICFSVSIFCYRFQWEFAVMNSKSSPMISPQWNWNRPTLRLFAMKMKRTLFNVVPARHDCVGSVHNTNGLNIIMVVFILNIMRANWRWLSIGLH